MVEDNELISTGIDEFIRASFFHRKKDPREKAKV